MRVADDLSTGKPANLAVLDGRAEVLIGDLADIAFARTAVDGVDLVLHQAAIPSVPRSVADPLTSHRANVDATLAVLVAARDAGVRRLVYAALVVGVRRHRRSLPKREDMPPNPLSPYALQKLVGEQYLQLFTRLYGLDTVTIALLQRVRAATGPLVALLRRHRAVHHAPAGRRLPPVITGDGEQTRDFTYVDNVVDGVLQAATAPGRRRTCDQRRHRPPDLDQPARADDPAPAGLESSQRRSTPSRAQAMSATRSRTSGWPGRVLGYEPQCRFEDGLRRTVDWYRAQRGLVITLRRSTRLDNQSSDDSASGGFSGNRQVSSGHPSASARRRA